MTCPAQSKWGALLCGSAVTSYGSWQKPCQGFIPTCQWTALVAQMVKHLPTMQETRVQSPGGKDLLEKEMAIHSSTLAWKIPWMEEPGGLQSMGSQRVGHDWATSLCFTLLLGWELHKSGSCCGPWLLDALWCPRHAFLWFFVRPRSHF